MSNEKEMDEVIKSARERILLELETLDKAGLEARISSIRNEVEGIDLKTKNGAKKYAAVIDGNYQAWEIAQAVSLLEEKFGK